MPATTNDPPQTRYQTLRRLLPWLLILAIPAFNAVLYSWLAGCTVITRDQWNFLPMLQDYFEGHFHLMSLWITDTEHRTPGYLLLFLGNAIFLKLNLRFELLLGVAALVLTVGLLLRRFLATQPANAGWIACLGFIAIAVYHLGLNQWESLTYSMDTLGWNGGTLCFVLFWLMLDTDLHRAPRTSRIAANCVFLAFTLLMFAAARGPAFLVASFLVAACMYLGERDFPKPQRRLMAWLLIAAVLAEFIYWRVGPLPTSQAGLGTLWQAVIARPGEALEYILLAFANSVIPADFLAAHLSVEGIAALGAVVVGLYLLAAVLYVRERMWRRSCLPGFLLVYTCVFIASIFFGRFDIFGLGNATSPRYVLDTEPGFTACLWIGYTWLATHPRSERRPGARLPLLVAAALCVSVVCLEIQVGRINWDRVDVLQHSYRDATQRVYQGSFPARDWVCPHPDECVPGSEILKRYGLNVFNYPLP